MANLLSTTVNGQLNTGNVIDLGYTVNGSVATSAFRGINFHSFGDLNYYIGKPEAAWVQPLHIHFYTGIWLRSHQAYGGTRFYNIETGSQLMSIGDGADIVNIYSGLTVSGSLTNIGASYLGIIYDYDNNNYYLNPTGTSVVDRVVLTGRLEVTYNDDRYQMNFLRGAGSNWWVTNESNRLGLHLNAVGDKFYFATDGDFWTAQSGWLSTALNNKQDASTAITVSNIGSQSVNYANSSGNSATTSQTSFVSLRDSLNRRFIIPDGGSYVTSTSVITGAIRIKLPTQGSGMMMTCTAKVYEYSLSKSFTITFGGHRDGNNWYNQFCYIDGDTNRGNLTVRFGVSDGRDCVWIGETNSSWIYPQVFITDMQVGYTAIDSRWASGWSIDFVTSFDTINRTSTAYAKITNANIGDQSVNYAASAGNSATTSQRSYDYLYASSYLESSGAVYGTIFYDNNDRTYDLDPSGTSNLVQLNTSTRARWGMPSWWNDRSSFTSTESYWTGTNGWGTAQGTWANAWKGGFSGWDIWGTETDHPQGGEYIHAQGIVSGQHLATSDGSSGYGWMMVGAANAYENRYWLRGKWGTTTSGWVEMVTSGNIGSQSVDYAQKAGKLWNTSSNGYYVTYQYGNELNTYDTDGVSADLYINYRGGRVLVEGGNYVIHTGNIGSQSVSNADTVDSIHGTSFVRNDVAQPTVERHFDASTTWTNDAITLFLGWYGNKIVIGNGSEDNHDNAAGLGGNTVAITNTLYSFEQSNLYYDGSLKLYMGSDGTRNTGWAYHTNNGTGLHWPNNGWHLMPYDSADFRIHSGNTGESSLRFETAGTIRGYVYANSSNEIGFLNQDRNWRLRVYPGGSVESYGDFRAPIFYDSADTNYYGDFAGLSRMSEIGVTNHYVYNYDSINSPRSIAEFGYVGKYVSTQYADTNYIPFSFESTYGTHSWGQVARFHIQNASDRPSIQFSNGVTNTRWNIGYCYGDDNFRIVQNMGMRPDNSGTNDGWGVVRFYINTSGQIYIPELLQSDSSLRAPIFYDSQDTTYYLDPANSSLSLNVAGYTKSKFTYRNNSAAGLPGQDNPVKTATGVLATLSGSGGGNEYIIIKTRVPQDSYQMGSFTIDLFARYGDTNAKTTISLGGYWNPESNGGFQGWEYNTTNPNVRPGIFVMRDVTDGSTCFAIQISKAYPVIVARDLYLGYNSADIEGWLDWSIFGADDLGGYTNNDTVACRHAMPVDQWYGSTYIAGDGRFYGTIFYDTNDTDYYLDPNGTSRLSVVNDNGGWTSGVKYFYSNRGATTSINATDSASLQAFSSDNGPAFMSFHRSGQYAVNFGLDYDNVIRVGGWSASSNRMQLDMSGNVTFAGDVTAYSDARVKENVHTIENALDKTLQLRGVTYNRTDSEDKSTKVGVIAQEVLEVVPEVVNQDASGMYNVSYGNLTAVLIEAIKEQQKQIDELKEIINGLTK